MTYQKSYNSYYIGLIRHIESTTISVCHHQLVKAAAACTGEFYCDLSYNILYLHEECKEV